MKRCLLLISIALLSASAPLAKDNLTLTLTGEAVEGFSGEAVKEAKGVILNAETNDTVAKALTRIASVGSPQGGFRPFVQLEFIIPKKPAKYLIEAYAPGYDTVYREYVVDKLNSREYNRSLPRFVFYKTMSRNLGELTVTASKVKFYVKGDTIVYNADAFQLAQGSMLDALIKQLPGVELKENGEIYVNGKYVESLLLNGKDFFKGDKNIMLNNLGAYTVKDVAVYNKWSEQSSLVGHNLGDEEFVMDVRLKKEFLSGYIGNIEAGAGTSERYLGRLFGMWFTSRNRLTLIGNINNLNDSRKPGQNDSYTATQNPGDFRTKMVGLDYNVTADDGRKWEFSGNTTLNHTRNNTLSSTYLTSFLPLGDTYQTTYAGNLTKSLTLSTNNNFRWRPRKTILTISQNLNYSNNDSRSQSLSGTFLSEASNITQELLHRIYTGDATSLSGNAINTSLTQTLSAGTRLSAGGSIATYIAFKHIPDLLSIDVGGGYTGDNYDTFNRYGINYNRLGEKNDVYQYIDNKPNRNWNINGSVSYNYVFSKDGNAGFGLQYKHTDKIQDSYLYDLDRLEDAGIFGILPNEYASTLNNDQTFMSHEGTDAPSIYSNIYKSRDFTKSSGFSFQIIPRFTFNNRFLDYKQGAQTDKVSKRSLDVEFSNTHIYYSFPANGLRLHFERQIELAALNRMIDIVDNRNPLNIFSGNKDLKNQAKNALWFTWEYNMRPAKVQKHRWYNMFHIKYTFFQNALTNGYSLDTETGVRTYKIFNVAGNYWLSFWDYFSLTFGKNNQFSLGGGPGIYYIREYDMMANNGNDFTKSRVNTLRLNGNVDFKWRIGKFQLGLNTDVNLRNTHGVDAGFTDFSAFNGQYGLSALWNLPYNFSLSTDFNIYTRKGYSEAYLNSTDLVWNGRLSYTTRNGKWVMMLDAFDILNQLSNITYNVTATGRIEVHVNTLPRYVLFHVQYRFTIQPQKK